MLQGEDRDAQEPRAVRRVPVHGLPELEFDIRHRFGRVRADQGQGEHCRDVSCVPERGGPAAGTDAVDGLPGRD